MAYKFEVSTDGDTWETVAAGTRTNLNSVYGTSYGNGNAAPETGNIIKPEYEFAAKSVRFVRLSLDGTRTENNFSPRNIGIFRDGGEVIPERALLQEAVNAAMPSYNMDVSQFPDAEAYAEMKAAVNEGNRLLDGRTTPLRSQLLSTE